MKHSADDATDCPTCGRCTCAMTEATQLSCPLHGLDSTHLADDTAELSDVDGTVVP